MFSIVVATHSIKGGVKNFETLQYTKQIPHNSNGRSKRSSLSDPVIDIKFTALNRFFIYFFIVSKFILKSSGNAWLNIKS